MPSLAPLTVFPSQPASLRPLLADAPAPAPEEKKPEDGESRGDCYERISRTASSIGNAMAKVPRALMFVPNFLRFAVLDGLVPLVQFTAGLGGVAAFIGAGVAGVLEIVDGVQEKDPIKVLSGAGETSRGAFLGTVTASILSEGTPRHAAWGTAGDVFSYATGGFLLAAGAMRYRHGVRAGDRSERIEGLLEMGIGTCSLAATQGTLLYPAIALQTALVITKFGVKNHAKIKDYTLRACRRMDTTWEHFKDLFRRDEDGGKAASP